MAVKQTDYPVLDLGVAINRQNGQPLDPTDVWYDWNDLCEYAKSNQAFVGQRVTYVDASGDACICVIEGEGEESVPKKLASSKEDIINALGYTPVKVVNENDEELTNVKIIFNSSTGLLSVTTSTK